MAAQHDPRRPRQPLTDELCAWTRELDACDGYLVIVGPPLEEEHHRILGPFRDRDALMIADQLGEAGEAPVRVVRFHHPRTAAGPAIPRPRAG